MHYDEQATTMIAATSNWEAEQLGAKLSRRVGAAGDAYWGAGARPTPSVPLIALTGGIPDPQALPIEELIQLSSRVLRREGQDALRYGGPQGHPGLREWLAQEASRREGLHLTAEHVTITNGSAGALTNVCETFLDEGDVALTEAPTYPGAVRIMRSCLSDVRSVPIDAEGLLPQALEETIERLERQGRRAKLLYTIPNFHNPAGVTMSLARRRAVVESCRRHQVLIVEDDAYGAIRFEGERLPSLFALAGGEGAVYVGTFSKTLATGLRLGWALAALPVVAALVRMRFDLGASPWLQRTVAEFATTGSLGRHVARVIDVYRRKRDALVAALEERCRRYVRWHLPEGGFFLWLTLDGAVDPAALAAAADRLGVTYVSGAAFFLDGSGDNFIRLAYSFVSEEESQEAAMRLGRALEEAAASASEVVQ